MRTLFKAKEISAADGGEGVEGENEKPASRIRGDLRRFL